MGGLNCSMGGRTAAVEDISSIIDMHASSSWVSQLLVLACSSSSVAAITAAANATLETNGRALKTASQPLETLSNHLQNNRRKEGKKERRKEGKKERRKEGKKERCCTRWSWTTGSCGWCWMICSSWRGRDRVASSWADYRRACSRKRRPASRILLCRARLWSERFWWSIYSTTGCA